jgi:putative transposase
MINRKHDLPILRQCKALKVHRTTIYREPKPVKQEQLDLMKVIDTIHLDEPSWGDYHPEMRTTELSMIPEV